jgi:hypothetical protein
VNDVKKIELIGVQDEKIYIDVSPARLAAMGLVPTQVFDALQRQNAVVPAGQVETETDRVRLRVTGPFDSVEALRDASLAVGGRSFRLGDIARVTRGLADPPQPRMRVAGRDAIGLGIVMARGGNVIDLGDNLSNHGAPEAGPAGGHGRAWCSTSRRSSRPRSTSSSAPWARRWSSCSRCPSSASAGAPAPWWRCRSRWCWR